MNYQVILSLFAGITLGILYAMSAFLQRQMAILLFSQESKKNAQLKIIIISFLRLFIIFCILYCLYGLQNINFILTVITFIIVFWGFILKVDFSNYF